MAAMVCGICGGSGSGKTTFTRHLVDRIGPERTSILSFDAYYRDQSDMSLEARRAVNYDHPDSLDHELFSRHLDQLRDGHDVDVPVYDFTTHTLSGQFARVEARPMILVEGILILAFAEIVERLDMAVFLDVPEPVRLHRRMHRDVNERGRHPDDIRRQFEESVAPMHELFVQPHREHADEVIRLGEPFDVVAEEVASRLLARQAV